jgi:uncharacterized protein (DUF2141 family)
MSTPSRMRRFWLGLRRAIAVLGLALCGHAVAAGPATSQGVGSLTVHAVGFSHPQGQAIAKLFLPGDDVLGRGRWQQSASIRDGAATFCFEGLSAGTYAVVVFHDENGNGIIDHGLLGPSDPVGFSGGFALSILSGFPSSEKLKFEFRPPAQTLEIKLR